MSYRLVFTGQAQRDAKKISRAGLKKNVIKLLTILEENRHQGLPRYEKLLGDLEGAFSRRINIQHRLVYQILEEEKIIKVIRMWTHYELAAAVRRHGRPRALAIARVSCPFVGGQ